MTDVMTSKKRRKKKVPYPFAVELIEQLQGQVEHKDGESILGETGLAGQLKKMLAERMLSAELSHHLLYGTQVSPELISTITDEVLEEVAQWQQRPLEALYPIVYFDALRLKIRDEGTVKNKAVYLALGVRADGRKEVLGLWMEQTEGAKFWLKVFNELKNRGLNDVLIAVVDGLRGFLEAIEAVYPQAQIQTCIVHLIRNSTTLASWKDRQELAAALKTRPPMPSWRPQRWMHSPKAPEAKNSRL